LLRCGVPISRHHWTKSLPTCFSSTLLPSVRVVMSSGPPGGMLSPGAPAGGAAAASGTGVPAGLIRAGVEYRCGDCGARNLIKGGDPVRCRQCGFRILYKTRTKRCKSAVAALVEGVVVVVCYRLTTGRSLLPSCVSRSCGVVAFSISHSNSVRSAITSHGGQQSERITSSNLPPKGWLESTAIAHDSIPLRPC
jgi:DNA-directed RNA polymerase subunit RPC12/RpoP